MIRYIVIYNYFDDFGSHNNDYRIFYDVKEMKCYIKRLLRVYPHARIISFKSSEMEMINYEF